MSPPDRYLSHVPPTGRVLSAQEREQLMADMERTVQNSHLFRSLDDAGREKIFRCGYVCSFPDGFVMMREAEAGDTMYLLLSGKVRVETGIIRGGSVTLAELGPGAFVGEVAVLTGQPRTATVTALGDVSCVAFAAHRIQRVLTEYPEIHQVLLTLIESRARNTIEKLIRRHNPTPSSPPSDGVT